MEIAALHALVRVGDDELETAQDAACKAAQEVGPEGLGLGRADRHAEHFATTVAVGPTATITTTETTRPTWRTFT